MSKKINKLQAANIAGMSQKWIENKINGDGTRNIEPDVKWLELTGFQRLPNGRVSFDEQSFRAYYAGFRSDNIGFNGNLENLETDTKNSENLATMQNENPSQSLSLENARHTLAEKPSKPSNEIFNENFRELVKEIFLIPHERIVNLKEAMRETGLTRKTIKQAIADGRILAKRRNPVERTFKGKTYLAGRLEISLMSAKQFARDYLNSDE